MKICRDLACAMGTLSALLARGETLGKQHDVEKGPFPCVVIEHTLWRNREYSE